MAASKTLDVSTIVERFEQIVGWPYESPGSNDKNGIDCSGAFVRAYRMSDLYIYHGSNRIERRYCNGCFDTNGSTAGLQAGMAVFKYREPGDAYYDLGSQYKPGGEYYNGDVRDYYHIGLVASTNPLRIIHATPPAAKVDTKIGTWRRAGFLDAVTGYKKGDTNMTLYDAKVNTPDEGTLNFRNKPQKGGTRIGEIPYGTVVQVLEKTNNEWSKVFYSGKEGYVMSEYLEKIEPGDGGEGTPVKGSFCVAFYFDSEEEANAFKAVCQKGQVEAG